MSKAACYNWADLPPTAMTPQIERRFISGENVMLVQFRLAKGARIAEHHHPHEQMSCVLSGQLEFDVQGEKHVVKGGEVIHFPANVPHAAYVLEDSVVLDAFSPPREDFLSGEQADYMK
jgi:quercetin dioxygenase-like cupin family protein